MSQHFSRRGFMMTSAGVAMAAGPAVRSSLAANDKINVGFIAAGSRGNYLIERLYVGSGDLIQVGSVCDTYAGNLARAKDHVQTNGKNTPKTGVDYREILADPSIDAVVIATPEHLHHSMTLAAIKANKHIYVEKPLAHTIEEGAEVVKAAANYPKIIQVGTQNRSNPLYQKAKQMVQQGMIGEVHYVRAFWYRNFPMAGSPNVGAAWRYVIPADVNESNTDWARFLGPAPKRPFNVPRYFQWRNYWDYSGGISTDLLVHQTDISNYVLGKNVPISCMASGGIYQWGPPKDDREAPDTLSAIYEYADKFHLNYSCFFGNDQFGYGEQFMGYEGMIEVLNRSELNFVPQKFGGKLPAGVQARQELHQNQPPSKGVTYDNLSVELHLRNWIDSIRGTAKPIAPAKEGQIAAIPGHLATLSYKNGRKILWDAKTEKYRFS
jgi:predicted dehydrogenase